MAKDLVFQLQRIGFEEREAGVYLATLELGPSPVQKIAQRAGVPRATAYLILEDLQNKGFITTYYEGKKTLFVAEAPDRLATAVDERETEIKQQKDIIKTLVPELTSRGQFEKGERPVVRYYEGAESVKRWVRDSLSTRGGEMLGIIHLDRATETLKQIGFPIEEVRKQRKKQRIRSRVIYTSKKGLIPEYSTKERKAKYVSNKEYPFDADIGIRQNRVFFASYSTPFRAVAIEDRAIANAMRMVFELLWKHLPNK